MDFSGASKVAFALSIAFWAIAMRPTGEAAFAQTTPPGRVVHGRLRLSKFYDTPTPLPASRPGSLIRSQSSGQYDLPLEASAVRILYHSLSPAGEDVAASGVVLLPGGIALKSGWPVIAWAHGFIGNARPCAPSLMRNLYSGSFLSMYLNLGYAVVIADYAGLGSNFRNAFGDLPSNATDVIYAVQAARAAVPQLSARWIAMGDGAGGAAALALAEMEAQRGDRGYLGSVAISGALDLRALAERLAQGPWQDTLASLAYGIKTVYPQSKVDDILTEKALPRYRQLEQDCMAAESPSVPASEMVKPGWTSSQFAQDFFQRSRLGSKPATAPLLVISAGDPKAADSVAGQVIARMCRQGDRIDFESYPGMTADSVIGGSVSAQIAWIQARFSGRRAVSNCH
jgi:acetyl esterase/lipase